MTTTEPNAAPSVPEPSIDLDVSAEDAAQIASQHAADIAASIGEASSAADPSAPAVAADLLDAPAFPSNGEALREADGLTALRESGVAAPPRLAPAAAPVQWRISSGRYRSQPVGFQLELRVDIDGRRPLGRLSGDYYSVSGATTSYFGSWTVDAVTVHTSSSEVVVIGTARTTWTTTYTVARVTIPRRTVYQPAAPATIRWSTPSGAKGATYVCAREATAYRTVALEQDCESGVTPFTSYNTGSLASGGPARTLSVAGAYGEAGIQMIDTGGANVIKTPAGHIWNNASLHNAMVAHFSKYANVPQFKVWLMHAMRHEIGSGLLGIMFDQQGLQRQGCASFYQNISSGSAQHRRLQLYVNVHELGHCFNLFHSFHKSFMDPPRPNRPGALSWMNYPQNYQPGGAAAFWAAFPFQFDGLELAHLRHGFRNAVIMGGNPFGKGAALEAGEEFADRLSDTSGLELRISTSPARPILGTPVVLQINLAAERGQQVHSRDQLHPRFGFVDVAVSRPRGDTIVHRPPVTYCAEPELVTAGSGEELPVSAYIGYDAEVGQIFEDVGTYRIRATYTAPDGSIIVSGIATVRIAAPQGDYDEQVADLMLGDEAGMVLTLLGSDSEYLSTGTRALETVLAEHGNHPNAVYARLALGMNAARPFTAVQPDGAVQVREPDLHRADELLGAAVETSRGDGGLDDLTVYQVLGYLAGSHEAADDSGTARSLRDDAIALARSKDAPASVIQGLEE